MEKTAVLDLLRQEFPREVKEAFSDLGDEIIIIEKESLLPIVKFLRGEPHRYDLLLDLTCVDYLGQEPRFEMVYHLYSLTKKRRLRIKTRLSEKELCIASLTELWKNANWLEREIYDLFGVHFESHPDLRRIFMYDGFEGYPLRKDYPLRKRQPRLRMRE
ncbi:MAG: NADH-quinone oxidoreductase subunit C [Clostridiales bacterium]|nr:NADH-quinone oxidoreductase subunit C [Clostridiales bacterium]